MSRKSDPPTSSPAAATAAPPAWRTTLLTNIWVPVALALLVALGYVLEHAEWSAAGFNYSPYQARVIMLIGINITLAVSLQLINGISGQFSLGHAGFMAVGAYLGGYAILTYGAVTTPDEDIIDFANPAGVLVYFVALVIVLALGAGLLFGILYLIRLSRRLHRTLPPVLLLGVFVWLVADVSAAFDLPEPRPYHAWSQLFIGIEKLFGWLIERGAAPAAAVSAWVPELARRPVTLLIALIGGGLIAAVAGFVIGLPTLRLRGDYLAIATLGFAEIIRVVIVNSQPLGAATGLSVPVYSVTPYPEEGVRGYWIFPWIYGVALVTTLVIWRLKHSPKGRALQAVREDEIAAAAVGIDTTHHKVIAFVIGAFFAGVAGALYANYDGYLNTNSFGFQRSIEIVVMVTVGGLGSIWGAIAAAVLLTLLQPVLQSAQSWMPGWLPAGFKDAARWMADNRLVIYSLLLILIMIVRAKGWLRVSRWWPRRNPVPAALPT